MLLRLLLILGIVLSPTLAYAATAGGGSPLAAPVEYYIFALILLGVAVLHRHALWIALAGLGAILLYQGLFGTFPTGHGLASLGEHLKHEWVTLANLMLLL